MACANDGAHCTVFSKLRIRTGWMKVSAEWRVAQQLTNVSLSLRVEEIVTGQDAKQMSKIRFKEPDKIS